jgi:hypothetical protein
MSQRPSRLSSPTDFAVDVIFDMTRKLKINAIVFFIAVYFEPQINQNFKANQKLNLPDSKNHERSGHGRSKIVQYKFVPPEKKI